MYQKIIFHIIFVSPSPSKKVIIKEKNIHQHTCACGKLHAYPNASYRGYTIFSTQHDGIMRSTSFFIGTFSLLFAAVTACTDKETYLLNPNTGDDTSGSSPETYSGTSRMLWASINARKDATSAVFSSNNNRILVSWRLLDTDNENIAFDLYRTADGGDEIKLNSAPISRTCFQDNTADRSVDNTYRLTLSGQNKTLDKHTITAEQASNGLPYISIPLQNTYSISNIYEYKANDASIGDLDGDGKYEIILKRLISGASADEDNKDDGDDTGSIVENETHAMLLEAYRLDGTFLWRMKMGPNIVTGNGGSFAVYDFDGDGCCEIAVRTAEGTVFGDGKEIGDTNNDGKTDYRVTGARYVHGGPEFLSIIEGNTGKELARTDYIELGSSEDWGDNYYKRSSSYRVAVAHCTGNRYSVIIGRGCYRKIVIEAWDYHNGILTKQWRFDTTQAGNEAYAGQGYHSLSVGDVDEDSYDEIVYGSMTVDNDGTGLNSCGFGHGDALHLGKFDPSRNGLQIWSCFESGTVGAALRDARTGEVIWKHDSPGDVGRALVADINPDSPGCEMWWSGGNVHSADGTDLGYKASSCNMAIWFNGSLNRQLLNQKTIEEYGVGRVFTLYHYGVTDINGSKSNPCIYGDFLGDWREEIVMPTSDNTELRIFSTWYPTEYSFPYLMSDPIYHMSLLNQNVGYNQPTQLGYYLGSDLTANPQ